MWFLVILFLNNAGMYEIKDGWYPVPMRELQLENTQADCVQAGYNVDNYINQFQPPVLHDTWCILANDDEQLDEWLNSKLTEKPT